MHWADVLAKKLLERSGSHTLATAITPSGPIHVGNMREVLTSEMVHRAIQDAGGESEFLYIADSYDPLRKVYPFLDEEDYAPYVGRPLKEIPAPGPDGTIDDGSVSYSDHFLQPFLQALDDMGIKPRVLDAYTMYKEGMYGDTITTALEKTGEVREIIERVSKRQLKKSWLPFNVQCQACGSLRTVPLVHEHPTVTYKCETCDVEADVDATRPGTGKLPWRVDWPARWTFLGVTFEAAGKDHHASGGSWDTGREICRQVYGHAPPEGLMYEFIQLKGKGAMHSSTGNVVTAEDMLRITPPEVLRFLIARTDPKKHIDFDPGLGILNLVDDYDRFERIHYGTEEATTGVKDAERVYALSQPYEVREHRPVQVPYRHLVTVAQMAASDDVLIEVLQRTGDAPDPLPEKDRAHLAERAAHVRAWIGSFAPEDVRFTVQDEPPALDIDPDTKRLYQEFVKELEKLDEWTGSTVHDALYAAKETCGVSPKETFRAVYHAVLDRERGPRAGHFLATLGPDFVLPRFKHYAEA